MGERPNKRKEGPGASNGSFKKSRGGSNGKWQTPFQKSRKAEKVELGTALAVGDAGIWVTYARGMNGKAQREFKELCYTYGESLFGVKAPNAEEDEAKEDEEQDIEASIQAELEGMKTSQKPTERQVFSVVQTSIECVFFMKTMDPVDPDRLVRQMCQDAKACPDPRQRKTRYVNRLTPVMDTDKATETGIDRVARAVLASHFTLNPEEGAEKAEGAESVEDSASGCTYAIRHNIRNHKVFKSDAVIKKVASLVSPKHKVNLTNPDKVILVEIFQNHCGVSVVDGKEWEDLKRYNLNELYKLGLENEEKEKADTAATDEKKADAVVEEKKVDATDGEKAADATSEEKKAETVTEEAAAAVSV